MSCHAFVDFDGTIATVDTTDLLLERFAGSEWHAIEEEWKAGRIGSRECMVRQIDLIRASPADLDRFIEEIEIDPGFVDFVRVAERSSCAITVISDGLDRTVGKVLARHGLRLPFRANRLEWIGGNRWRLAFPHAKTACVALAGNCKCQFAEAETAAARIVVGDGRSDFCIARRADFVLAKSSLLDHCQREGLPYLAFDHFGEASEHLVRWTTAHVKKPAKQPAHVGEK